MFLNSSSNHFNISSFLQQNKFTLIPLATNYLLFPHSTPGAHGIKAQEFLEAVQAHGQYSQNNSKDDRSPPFHMESKSPGMNDSESHNAEPLKILQAHGQYSQNNSMDDRSLQFHMAQVIWHE
jgi:hypothetical protein